MAVVLNTIVPVFSIIGLGYILAGRAGLHVRTVADLSILVASPALIFTAFIRTDMPPGQWGIMAGGAAWIVAGTAVLAFAYVRRDVGSRRGLLLPAVFWNAGNMALPCAQLAFGQEGFDAAVMVFVTMAVLQSTAGIWIAKGTGGFAEVFRTPLIHACLAGLFVTLGGITVPAMISTPVGMVGDMAIPLMLLNLGMQLRTLHLADIRHSITAVLIRMGGGLVCALAFVALFAVTGLNRDILLLHAIMPPAVINVVLAERYSAHPTLVASTIVLGTLVSVVTIPLLLIWLM